MVLHQLVRGVLPEVEGRQTWDFDPDWLPAKVSLVLMGDFHRVMRFCHVRPGGGRIDLAYNGSLCMQDVREPPEKFFLEIHGGDDVHVRPLETRPFREFILLKAEEIPAALVAVTGLAADGLAVVRYDPQLGDVEERCRAANAGLHFMFHLLPSGLPEAEASAAALPGDLTLEGFLDTVADRNADPAFHGFMHSLLRSRDAKAALAAARTVVTAAEAATCGTTN
jgi:hypothetical protein